jgi:hypothetical protein
LSNTSTSYSGRGCLEHGEAKEDHVPDRAVAQLPELLTANNRDVTYKKPYAA